MPTNSHTSNAPPQLDGLTYWGKARPDDLSVQSARCHLLAYHCLDVAAVGIEVLQRLPTLRALFSRSLGLREEWVEAWTAFWLSLHDLGKFSEAFQSQCPDVFKQLRGRLPNPAKPYTLRHDSLGMLFWKDVLRDRVIDEAWFGPRSEDLADSLDCWARACTGHHGQPPTEGDFWRQHFDPQQDRDAALAFAAAMRGQFITADAAGAVAAQDPHAFLAASTGLSWWLAGLAVLADWLGSNTQFFPYHDQTMPIAEYWQRARRQAAQALDASGVLPPPSAAAMPFDGLFPRIANPSPLQQWASEAPLASGPQIHLLEDVTGAGKTEAAIMLTHRLMAAGCADGFFIALPTMATANAMYGRIADAYALLFSGGTSLVLAHGQRRLVDDFAASVLPAGDDEHDARQLDDTASARCTAWLADHNKRALLSPAGVGTIDQVLLAVLHSKHQSLRLLGLVRKVLVIDEVHACDVYMQGVLEVLLTFHSRAGGSAILLSATLPQRMKQSLLAAFAKGLDQATPLASETAYPLVTSWCSTQPAHIVQCAVATRPDVQRRVGVQCSSETSEVVAAIRHALAAGRCVCWVRNTVADAIAAFELFEHDLPPERLMLFHARFALRDRLQMERRVLALFGPRSTGLRRAGRLLIATQVVEQSLDVDFDLLVTDLAPIDRVIQRAGRLHRHRRGPNGTPLKDPAARDQRGEPLLWVLTPPWTEQPDARWFKDAFPKGAAVYAHHGQNWLTARALQGDNGKGAFTMPDDARQLIEGVFGADADIPPGLDANALAAEGQGFANLTQAQMNTVKLSQGYQRGGIDWWSEAKTPSRLGEATSTLALARWQGERLVPWVEGKNGWAYSSLRMAERLIAATAPAADARQQPALEATLVELPAQGRWTVLLPLALTPQGWVGQALAAPRNGQPARRLAWCYDPRMGLRLLGKTATDLQTKEDPEA
ncbi:MAG: CRISPR-associated helicase Cas3' [Rubrivivax sp.]